MTHELNGAGRDVKAAASPHAIPLAFAVTFFTSASAGEKHEGTWTLPTLAARIRTVTANEKRNLPWLKLARFGDVRTDKNSFRHDGNVLSVTGIEADYDGGVEPIGTAVETLEKAGILALVYTSPSHTPAAPRWRVICPASGELPPDQRAKLMGRLNGLFRGIFAAESWTLSQAYYYGSVNHNPAHEAHVIDGQPIDEADELDEIWIGKPATGSPHTAPGLPRATGPLDEAAMLADIISGASYHASAVRLLGKWALAGLPMIDARGKLLAAFDAVPTVNRDARWTDRRADADRCLIDIYGKQAGKQDADRAGPSCDLSNPDMTVLRLNRRPPPSLPLDVFGPHWSRWIVDTATAAACPVDYVAAPLLAAASCLIGNARWPEAWPGWREPPHLWTCGVGDSGGGKSPGADVLLRDVLPVIEQRMAGDFPDRLRDWRAANEAAVAAQERWKGDVRAAQKEGNPPPLPPTDAATAEPQAPRLRQNDVTIERVATLLASAAPKGVLIHRDELLGWVAGMNAYNDAGRAFWIEAYGGRPYRVERQKNPAPIDVPRLAVAAFGGTQPAKLATLLHDADDGLMSRICWFWPDPVPFRMGGAVPGVAWAIEALDRLRWLELASGASPTDPAQPVIVPLAETLRAHLEDFGREMQTRQAAAGGLMQSAYAKARGLALRVGLVLEYLMWASETGSAPPPARIGDTAFFAATHLVADYLMPMAERVYGDAATRREDRDAATLARWIIRTKPAEVHVRTLQREVRLPGLGTADAIHAAAGALQDAGWLLPPASGGYQQRGRAAYPVNPRIFEVAA